jgi:NitT/TauT family transport system substrate-binding protein
MAIAGRRLATLGLALATLAGCGSAAGVSGSSTAASAAKPVSASASAGGGSAAAKASGLTLRLATGTSSPTTMFGYLAADKGLYAKNGVKVDLQTMSGQAQMQAVVAGESEANLHVGSDLVFATEAQGQDLRIVATYSKVDENVLLSRNDITAVEQLKGKKLGSQTLTSSNGAIARRLLAKYGLQDGKDYTSVVTGSAGGNAGALAALVSGQVDAVGVPAGVATKALQQGQVHVLVDFATRTDLPSGTQVLVFPAKYVQQHPDAVQGVVDALIESVRTINQDKAAAESVLRSRFKMTDQAELDEELQRQVRLLAKVPLPVTDDFPEAITSLPKDVKPLTEAQFKGMMDPTFVNDAVKRGLTNY